MAKRKTARKPVVKRKTDQLAVVFDCPSCNTSNGVSVRIRKKERVANLNCNAAHCRAKYHTTTVTSLTKAIDVYLEWKDGLEDEAERVVKARLVEDIEAGVDRQAAGNDTRADTGSLFALAVADSELQVLTTAIEQRSDTRSADQDTPTPSSEKNQTAENKSTVSKLTKEAKVTKSAKPKVSPWAKKWVK